MTVSRRAPPGPIRLLRLSREEREAFLESQVREYADEKSRAGLWTQEESLPKAEEDIRRLLVADGLRAHRFLKGVLERRTVGWVWVGPVPGSTPGSMSRWLYQITVEEALRGLGHGRALLAATEAYLRARGVRELRLNVFAWNQVARRLYETAGYAIASRSRAGLEMRKRLR